MAWTEQLASGKYRGVYRIPDGTRRRTNGTFAHKAGALRAANTAEAETRKAGWRDPEAGARTWGEWRDTWTSSRTVEQSTASSDNNRIALHISPRWEDTPLAEITRLDIRAWVKSLHSDGSRSPTTAKRILTTFSASLSAAVEADILPANPAAGMRLNIPSNNSERVYTRAEQHALFIALTNDFDRALVATLLGTGCRLGEALALEARHFDLTADTVRFRQAWDTRNQILKPYTKGKTRRTVPLAPWLLEIIIPRLEQRPVGFIFAAPELDHPIDVANWRKRNWEPASIEANLNPPGSERGSIHTLRHTYATEQLEDGRTLAEIADLLGHGSITTAERYAHRRPKISERARTAVKDPRLAPPAPPEQQANEVPSNVIRFPGS